MKKRVVIALGGNAILQRGQKGTYEEQMENVKKTAKQ
ncbi:carbamate kinase, partial [Thermococci archaeon]